MGSVQVMDNNERLRELCKQVSQEQHGEKLAALVQELSDELQCLSEEKAPIGAPAEPNQACVASNR
jgi:hypothetical protein